jgi:hypothetical protein
MEFDDLNHQDTKATTVVFGREAPHLLLGALAPWW